LVITPLLPRGYLSAVAAFAKHFGKSALLTKPVRRNHLHQILTQVLAGGTRPQARPWLIALTAGAMKENRDECKAAGLDDFLTKPINVRELETALERGYAERLARTPRDSEKMAGTREGFVVEV
jgi:response regulator RpfG family c-di-GMP phosphodiesterase